MYIVKFDPNVLNFGYDFVVKCTHLHHILPKYLHAPGLLQRITTMCCNAMMAPIAMA